MDSVLDLFLGDRVYDENGKLIKRDFGIKNILAIAVVVFLGYSLMGKSFSFPNLSGKKKGKKMKGGGSKENSRQGQRLPVPKVKSSDSEQLKNMAYSVLAIVYCILIYFLIFKFDFNLLEKLGWGVGISVLCGFGLFIIWLSSKSGRG